MTDENGTGQKFLPARAGMKSIGGSAIGGVAALIAVLMGNAGEADFDNVESLGAILGSMIAGFIIRYVQDWLKHRSR